MKIEKLSVDDIAEIGAVIKGAFSRAPWNDDWRDEEQFHAYLLDLAGNASSLSLGLYDGEKLIGVSLGRLKHWYTGTEYWIDDLAIIPERQGDGCGTKFLQLIEAFIQTAGIVGIVLFTDRNAPAYGFYVKNKFEERSERVFFEKRLTPK